MVGTTDDSIDLILVLVCMLKYICIAILKNYSKADLTDRTPNYYEVEGVGGGKAQIHPQIATLIG